MSDVNLQASSSVARHVSGSTRQLNDRKSSAILALVAGAVGGLCCLTPIVLVLLGLGTVAVAADLGNVLYGEYRWVFRLAALGFIAGALVVYFRSRGICTLDQARRERNRILNIILVTLTGAAGMYILWTYVVLHYWGIAAGLPWAQYDETWAIPASVVVLVFFHLLLRRLR